MRDQNPWAATGPAPTDAGAASRQSRFSLAANCELDLVPEVPSLPVDEIHGKCPTDGTTGGRPRSLATPPPEADVRSDIRLLDQPGGATVDRPGPPQPGAPRVLKTRVAVGDAQPDFAALRAEDVDWEPRAIHHFRKLRVLGQR